jgi:hypothetical protein
MILREGSHYMPLVLRIKTSAWNSLLQFEIKSILLWLVPQNNRPKSSSGSDSLIAGSRHDPPTVQYIGIDSFPEKDTIRV